MRKYILIELEVANGENNRVSCKVEGLHRHEIIGLLEYYRQFQVNKMMESASKENKTEQPGND
jgi:hypothetical protein